VTVSSSNLSLSGPRERMAALKAQAGNFLSATKAVQKASQKAVKAGQKAVVKGGKRIRDQTQGERDVDLPEVKPHIFGMRVATDESELSGELPSSSPICRSPQFSSSSVDDGSVSTTDSRPPRRSSGIRPVFDEEEDDYAGWTTRPSNGSRPVFVDSNDSSATSSRSGSESMDRSTCAGKNSYNHSNNLERKSKEASFAGTFSRPGMNTMSVDKLPAIVATSSAPPLVAIKARTSKDASDSSPTKCSRSGRLFFQVIKYGILSFMVSVLLASILDWPTALLEDDHSRSQLLSALFLCGLAVVALEDVLHINKASVMLFLAAVMWTCLAVGYHPTESREGLRKFDKQLRHGLEDVGSVVLFLLPAMGLVESIDHFGGFCVVMRLIRLLIRGNREMLMPIVALLTFFLSSVIDNLTATIVTLKILRHLVPEDKLWRQECGGIIVIAANAGGAWSPIGDVTTTMLWTQRKITVGATVPALLLPSLAAGFSPLFGMWWSMRRSKRRFSQEPGPNSPTRASTPPSVFGRKTPGSLEEGRANQVAQEKEALNSFEETCLEDEITQTKVLAFVFGVFLILMVPCLKIFCDLPPYMGMLFALGVMWILVDCLGFESREDAERAKLLEIEGEDSDNHPSGVVAALHKVDLGGLLFFTGVLLSVGALNSAGILSMYASFLMNSLGHSPLAVCSLLGISSALVDNVPLVQAAIDMFDEPTDNRLWHLVALAAGTGGSCLSIGSIAGVTLMSMENVGFVWYMKRVGSWAFVGFVLGLLTYELQQAILG